MHITLSNRKYIYHFFLVVVWKHLSIDTTAWSIWRDEFCKSISDKKILLIHGEVSAVPAEASAVPATASSGCCSNAFRFFATFCAAAISAAAGGCCWWWMVHFHCE